MANYLNFLVAFDDHIRQGNLGYVIYGHELHAIAHNAGLVSPGDQSAARWAGELVALGYITHGPLGLGDRRPLPLGPYAPEDLSRVSDWRITGAGRAEADRIRRQRREELTDASLAGTLPNLMGGVVDDRQRAAIATPFAHLRAALDGGHHAAAVGAAKDLVEAAAKVCLERGGTGAPSNTALPALFKEALRASPAADPASELGRSLAATVQRLAELRNAAGSGHGRASQPAVSARDARLAASAACALAIFLLGVDDA